MPSDNSNEYMVTLTPSTAGTSYAYRFSVDGGRTCYGDHDASNVGGFSAETSGGPPDLGQSFRESPMCAAGRLNDFARVLDSAEAQPYKPGRSEGGRGG